MDLVETPRRLQFDAEALRSYLVRSLDGFSCSRGGLKAMQFRHGESNPTYHLLTDAGQEYVLRKKPPGKLLPGAHRVDREFQIISALTQTDVPVPRPLLYCSDASVVGTEFYLMECVKGRVFYDPSLADVSLEEKRAIMAAAAETLARLHAVDWRRLGLEDFGGHQRRGNYCQRQISIWSANYRKACLGEKAIEEMEHLMGWLPSNMPPQPHPLTIVHGDFRVDNLIFHPMEPRVLAVVDWELSTLGHPTADLAQLCMSYLTIPGRLLPVTEGVPNVPEEELIVRLYAEKARLSLPPSHWSYFKAFVLFRAAAILQGVYARSMIGNASSEIGSTFKEFIQPIAKAACSFTRPAFESQPLPPVLSFIHYSDKAKDILFQLKQFMIDHIYPAEPECYRHVSNPDTMWTIPPLLEDLKEKARKAGLWNLFLPAVSGLGQLEYAPMAEEMGRCPFASEVFNCSAPDTGNMEVLHLYGSEQQKKTWLEPLLEGKIRSCFSMTEPAVASSDATNISCTITRDGKEYVVNGRKWWSSGAGDPRCKLAIVMGVTNPDADRLRRHSMILVPMDTPGVRKIRPLSVFGYVDAPHGHFEIHYDHVRVPVENLILGEGRGFEIAQGRLGPGRIHHCMRLIGLSERALELMCLRAFERTAFGKRLIRQQTVRVDIAQSRMEVDQARLMVLATAHAIDNHGTKAARKQIAGIKVAVAQMACRVLDRAIQVHGGLGVCQDSPLAHWFAAARSLRIADGPDIVHLETVAKLELKEKAKL